MLDREQRAAPDAGRISARSRFIDEALRLILQRSGHGFFETLLYMIYRDWLAKPGSTVLDIGAHSGTHTFRLADCVGAKGRVLAFEPIISLAAGLAREAEGRYGVDQQRISVLPVAVSEEPGVAVFRHNLSRPSQSTIVDGHGSGGSTAVQTVCGVVSLDALFEVLGPTYLSFIKIDAEGNEYRILHGAQKTLARMSPIIAMEFTIEQLALLGRSVQDFQELANTLGYVFYHIDGTPFLGRNTGSTIKQTICYEVFGAKRGHWGEVFLSSKLPTLVERFLIHYAKQKNVPLPSLHKF